jgi:hypothetical protein
LSAIGHLPVYGPPTYEQAMDAWEAEELARAHDRLTRVLNPLSPPAGWDLDLWAEFAHGVNAERGLRWP